MEKGVHRLSTLLSPARRDVAELRAWMRQRYIAELWGLYLDTLECCRHCAIGNTADCDVNPLVARTVTREEIALRLMACGEVP